MCVCVCVCEREREREREREKERDADNERMNWSKVSDICQRDKSFTWPVKSVCEH